MKSHGVKSRLELFDKEKVSIVGQWRFNYFQLKPGRKKEKRKKKKKDPGSKIKGIIISTLFKISIKTLFFNFPSV